MIISLFTFKLDHSIERCLETGRIRSETPENLRKFRIGLARTSAKRAYSGWARKSNPHSSRPDWQVLCQQNSVGVNHSERTGTANLVTWHRVSPQAVPELTHTDSHHSSDSSCLMLTGIGTPFNCELSELILTAQRPGMFQNTFKISASMNRTSFLHPAS